MDDKLLDEIQNGEDVILSSSHFDNLPIEIPEFDTSFLENINLDLISESIIINEIGLEFKDYQDILHYIENNIYTKNEYFIFNIKLNKYNLQLNFRDKFKIYDYFHDKFNLHKYKKAFLDFYQ